MDRLSLWSGYVIVLESGNGDVASEAARQNGGTDGGSIGVDIDDSNQQWARRLFGCGRDTDGWLGFGVKPDLACERHATFPCSVFHGDITLMAQQVLMGLVVGKDCHALRDFRSFLH